MSQRQGNRLHALPAGEAAASSPGSGGTSSAVNQYSNGFNQRSDHGYSYQTGSFNIFPRAMHEEHSFQFGSISPGFLNGLQAPGHPSSQSPHNEKHTHIKGPHDSPNMVQMDSNEQKAYNNGRQQVLGPRHSMCHPQQHLAYRSESPIPLPHPPSASIPLQMQYTRPNSQGHLTSTLPHPPPSLHPTAFGQQQVIMKHVQPFHISQHILPASPQSLPQYLRPIGCQLQPVPNTINSHLASPRGGSFSPQLGHTMMNHNLPPRLQRTVKITHPDTHEELRFDSNGKDQLYSKHGPMINFPLAEQHIMNGPQTSTAVSQNVKFYPVAYTPYAHPLPGNCRPKMFVSSGPWNIEPMPPSPTNQAYGQHPISKDGSSGLNSQTLNPKSGTSNAIGMEIIESNSDKRPADPVSLASGGSILKSSGTEPRILSPEMKRDNVSNFSPLSSFDAPSKNSLSPIPLDVLSPEKQNIARALTVSSADHPQESVMSLQRKMPVADVSEYSSKAMLTDNRKEELTLPSLKGSGPMKEPSKKKSKKRNQRKSSVESKHEAENDETMTSRQPRINNDNASQQLVKELKVEQLVKELNVEQNLVNRMPDDKENSVFPKTGGNADTNNEVKLAVRNRKHDKSDQFSEPTFSSAVGKYYEALEGSKSLKSRKKDGVAVLGSFPVNTVATGKKNPATNNWILYQNVTPSSDVYDIACQLIPDNKVADLNSEHHTYRNSELISQKNNDNANYDTAGSLKNLKNSLKQSTVSENEKEFNENESKNNTISCVRGNNELATISDNQAEPTKLVTGTKRGGSKKKKKKEFLAKSNAGNSNSYIYNGDKSFQVELKQKECNVIDTSGLPTASNERPLSREAVYDKQGDFHIWEDAAEHSTQTIVKRGITETPKVQSTPLPGSNFAAKRKYSKVFLLSYKDHFTNLPGELDQRADIAELLVKNYIGISCRLNELDASRSPQGLFNRQPNGAVRLSDREDRWVKPNGHFHSSRESRIVVVPETFHGQGINSSVSRSARGQFNHFISGAVSGVSMAQSHISSRGRSKNSNSSRRGSRSTPQSHLPAMHKADKKYEIGRVPDEEQSKQRQIKAILNKLTPQNFEKLIGQVKEEVIIDSAFTLTGIISQIFDKALMEPTFCEMYAKFCVDLAADLPEFYENDEKITFKRVLLNKCQEEFERDESEQEEADRVEKGEENLTEKSRQSKQATERRRMLGNIRFIGELYKMSMLTERIMHECIKTLLGECENPNQENIEALCKLMSTIGHMIDRPQAKEYINTYFDKIKTLSDNQALSSRLRFLLKDVIDLRKNEWQQRRKEEGPKKIAEVHRDAVKEKQAQGRSLRGVGSSSVRRLSGSMLYSCPNDVNRKSPIQPGQRGRNSRSEVKGNFSQRISENASLGHGCSPRGFSRHGGSPRGLSHRGSPVLQGWNSLQDSPSKCPISPTRVSIEKLVGTKNNVPQLDSPSQTKEHILEKSKMTILEYYSVRDMKEVALCLEELKTSSRVRKIIVSQWIIDSFDRKNDERNALAELVVYLCKQKPNLLAHHHLLEGIKMSFVSLEDTVVDAPKAPKFMGEFLAKLILGEVISCFQCIKMVKEKKHHVDRVLALDVLNSIFEAIGQERDGSYLNDIFQSCNALLQDFLPCNNPKHCELDVLLKQKSSQFLQSLSTSQTV